MNIMFMSFGPSTIFTICVFYKTEWIKKERQKTRKNRKTHTHTKTHIAKKKEEFLNRVKHLRNSSIPHNTIMQTVYLYACVCQQRQSRVVVAGFEDNDAGTVYAKPQFWPLVSHRRQQLIISAATSQSETCHSQFLKQGPILLNSKVLQMWSHV